MWGDRGADTLYGGLDDDKLYGVGDADTIWGGLGADILDGGDRNDVLYGGDGDDTIRGQDGNDTAWGGPGNDTITGGNGRDTPPRRHRRRHRSRQLSIRLRLGRPRRRHHHRRRRHRRNPRRPRRRHHHRAATAKTPSGAAPAPTPSGAAAAATPSGAKPATTPSGATNAQTPSGAAPAPTSSTEAKATTPSPAAPATTGSPAEQATTPSQTQQAPTPLTGSTGNDTITGRPNDTIDGGTGTRHLHPDKHHSPMRKRTEHAMSAAGNSRAVILGDGTRVRLAGKLARCAARLIDTVLVGAFVAWCAVEAIDRFVALCSLGGCSEPVGSPWGFVVLGVVALLLEPVLVAVSGRTVGKLVMGIKVVGVADGETPTLERSLIRVWLPAAAIVSPLGLGWVAVWALLGISALARRFGRGWHDKWARTIVVVAADRTLISGWRARQARSVR